VVLGTGMTLGRQLRKIELAAALEQLLARDRRDLRIKIRIGFGQLFRLRLLLHARIVGERTEFVDGNLEKKGT